MDANISTQTAIIISAAVALGIAVFHFWWATGAARTKATYDAINEKQLDGDYLQARDMFLQARDKGPNGVADAVRDHTENPESVPPGKMNIAAAVRLIMNDYELMFIAIEAKVLDADFLKKWHRSTIIYDYKCTKSYVEWIRQQVENENLFEVFQRNAEAWEKEVQNNNNSRA